jgi:hypothetical protein
LPSLALKFLGKTSIFLYAEVLGQRVGMAAQTHIRDDER